MRHTILLFILFGIFFSGRAQRTTNDSVVIGEQVDAFFASWNKHDFSDMKNYVAEDCDFVNVAGMHWKGREDIQYAHNKTHEQIFKNKPLKKLSVDIRFLTEDVAIAHVQMHLEGTLATPDGSRQVDPDALATFVFLNKNGAWLITAVENVFVDKAAKPFDPVITRNNQSRK
jgi:uncharacterized protein (TIGR02246 family)